MSWHSGLTEMQRRFVEAYLGEAAGNATEAARLASYKHPRQMGSENLSKLDISEAISAYRSVLLDSGEYAVVDPMRIHREWLNMLNDPLTTNTQKINLLRDAARANSMFTENYKVEHTGGQPKRLVFKEIFDPEKESAEEYAMRHIKEDG